MDPLVPIPREEWPKIRDLFKKRWPLGVPGYYAMDCQIEHPEFGEAFGFLPHSPYGDVGSGLVAFNDKGALSEVIVLSISEDTTKLQKALEETKLIDWTKTICIPFCDTHIVDLMQKVFKTLNLKEIDVGSPTIKHFLSKDHAIFEDLECPQGTYVGPVQYKQIKQVDDVWPHKYETSPRFFEYLIRNGHSYGLFSKEDHSLLAWMFINEVGFLTHLYCEEKHRRKGYAEFVAKYVTNDLLKKNKDVFCYILEQNISSMKLFTKLDYKVIGRGDWIFCSSDHSKTHI